ncbi:asialoglycoprotein receptor 1-like [Asterias rubens]|uniref:asialoglycoprotein receptor 1-like n=1 Tax=Asterias rubens TaxID=7604 RepID=UPI00145560D9|nr:asialoglycoprotein receptor 1-like [Asterias rubens]
MAHLVIATIHHKLVSLFVIIIMAKGVFAPRGCPYGWVPYAESCYLGLDGSMKGDWTTAVMHCDRNNASLMLPTSDWENKFIFTTFQHHGDPIGVWINCNDAEVEGEWNCIEDGKFPTEYRKWDPEQPDDDIRSTDQDYGFMITLNYKNNPDVLGYWGDVDIDKPLFIVCERPRQARCG